MPGPKDEIYRGKAKKRVWPSLDPLGKIHTLWVYVLYGLLHWLAVRSMPTFTGSYGGKLDSLYSCQRAGHEPFNMQYRMPNSEEKSDA